MTIFDLEIGRVEGIRIISTPFVRPSGLGVFLHRRPEPPAYERELRPLRFNKLTKALHDADSRLVGPVALSENGTHGAKCFIWRSE